MRTLVGVFLGLLTAGSNEVAAQQPLQYGAADGAVTQIEPQTTEGLQSGSSPMAFGLDNENNLSTLGLRNNNNLGILTLPDLTGKVCISYSNADGSSSTLAALDQNRFELREGEDLLTAARRIFAPYRVNSVSYPTAVCAGPRPYPLMPPFFSEEERRREVLDTKTIAAQRLIRPITFDRNVSCVAEWNQVCNPDWDRPERVSTNWFYLTTPNTRFCSAVLFNVSGGGVWESGPRTRTRIGVRIHAVGSHMPWDRWRQWVDVGIRATVIPDNVEDEIFAIVCPTGPSQ